MTPSYGRTQEQHDNLQKLIDGLKAKPKHYAFFDMGQYARDDIGARRATPEHPCQTYMCVVGHGPSLGIPFTDEDINSWCQYSERAFGFEFASKKWLFCFASLWSMYCSSDINEAIARLEMAQRGEIPDDWDYDDIYSITLMETEQ